MGKGYNFKCKHCNYEKSLLLGTGMFNFAEGQLFNMNSKENILNYCSNNEEQNIVLDLIKKDYHLKDGFGYVACKCDKCNDWNNKFYFELCNYDDCYKSKLLCDKCGSQMKIVSENDFSIENIPGVCKQCNSSDYEIEYIKWD